MKLNHDNLQIVLVGSETHGVYSWGWTIETIHGQEIEASADGIRSPEEAAALARARLDEIVAAADDADEARLSRFMER